MVYAKSDLFIVIRGSNITAVCDGCPKIYCWFVITISEFGEQLLDPIS